MKIQRLGRAEKCEVPYSRHFQSGTEKTVSFLEFYPNRQKWSKPAEQEFFISIISIEIVCQFRSIKETYLAL